MKKNHISSSTYSLREVCPQDKFAPNSTLVLFGEIFQRGYANGLIEAAQAQKMNVIYSTVGRREKDQTLRPLTQDELAASPAPLINIPLEAGFDLTASSDGLTPVDRLKDVKMSEWKSAKIDLEKIAESRELARKEFRNRVRAYITELKKNLPSSGDILFCHLMAGGVPRAKVIMPLMNRVFKGTGERYIPSEDFWQSDLGKLCALSFEDVTAWTFQVLMEETAELRESRTSQGFRVGYTAYGYHGTEILYRGNYKWQGYAPYLQGWAKMLLEDYAVQAKEKNINACVYNCPEILTDSSPIFQGVEMPLYSLLRAYDKERPNHPAVNQLKQQRLTLLNPGTTWDDVFKPIDEFYPLASVQEKFDENLWPTHTTQHQLESMLNISQQIFDLHRDAKNIMTAPLSEKVFQACGYLMVNSGLRPQAPVLWINHDVIARMIN